VLSSIGMVAMMTMAAGKAAGQINVWHVNPGCPPTGSYPVTMSCGDLPIAYPPEFTALPSGSSWINATITPDRRPIAVIQFLVSDAPTAWGAGGNPEGLRDWWRLPAAGPNGTFVPDEPYDGSGNRVPDQIEALMTRIDDLYHNHGFRRFMLSMPAGVHCGRRYTENTPVGAKVYYAGQDIPTNQWAGMPQWKQEFFSDPAGHFQSFRSLYPSATFELYMGAPLMDDACTMHMHPATETYEVPVASGQPPMPMLLSVPVGVDQDPPYLQIFASRWLVPNNQPQAPRSIDPRDVSHVNRFWSIVSPWHNCGISTFWLDAGVDNECSSSFPDTRRRRFGLHEMAYNPVLRTRGVRLGGENFPCTDNDAIVLDQIAIRQVPYMALDNWVLQHENSIGANWPQDVRWDNFGLIPNQTTGHNRSELHILISDHELSDFHKMGEMRRRGFILAPINAPEQWKAIKIGLVQRWYSMGKFHAADFDADGVVNQDDWDMFIEQWQLNRDDLPGQNRKITVFATCDVNEDGMVNQADRDKFSVWWEDAIDNNNLGPIITFSGPYGL
jgi:hypothetical protein